MSENEPNETQVWVTVEMFDGRQYRISSPEDLVQQFWQGSFRYASSAEEYMEQFARRTMKAFGLKIKTGTCEEFMVDLIAKEIITIIGPDA